MVESKRGNCPNDPRLRTFFAGGSDVQEETQLSEHIEGCETCQLRLAELDASATLPEWFSGEVSAPDESVELQRRLSQLKQERTSDLRNRANVYTDLLPWLDPGEAIGRIEDLELLECIGRGGMGVVFRARQQSLNRTVAVKLLSPAMLADPAAPERFLREARSAASVNHPHVVTVHSVSKTRELPYLVMELVQGESLQQRIDREGPLASSLIAKIGRETAEALAAAHASGVMHRDVKPANVLLDDSTGVVKLTDFGLARVAEDSALTRTGFLVGTPEYVAPEQINGGLVDHRADLFSLGSVLYAMATGEAPFRGASVMETMTRVCSEQLPSVLQKNPTAEAWVDLLIGSLHAKQAAGRLQSAADVVATLQSVGPPAIRVPPPPSPPSTPPPPLQRSSGTSRRSSKRTSRSALSQASSKRVSRWMPIATAGLLAFVCIGIGYVAIIQSGAWRSQGEESSQSGNPHGDPNSMPDAVTIESSDELLRFLAEDAPRGKIQLTSNEPYFLPTLSIEDGDVSIFASPGREATIRLEERPGDPGLLVRGGSLYLEGVTIEADSLPRRFGAREEVGDDEYDEEEYEYEDSEPLVQVESARFAAEYCRFVVDGERSCLSLVQADGRLVNSELTACDADSVLWQPARGNSLELVNCVLIGQTNLAIEGTPDAEVTIDRTTFFGSTSIEIVDDGEGESQLSVRSEQSLFDAEECLLAAHLSNGETPLFDSWVGNRNQLPQVLMCLLDGEDNELHSVSDADDWSSTARVEETDSWVEKPQYVLPRQELIDQMLDQTLRASTLKLREGANVSGADLSQVGPEIRG